MDLENVEVGFINHCQGKGLSEHTLRAYKQDLGAYRDWLAGCAGVVDAYCKEAVAGWMLYLQQQGMAPASIRRRIACLKVLFRWLDEDGRLENNPFYKFRATVSVPRRLPRNLNPEELIKIFRVSAPMKNFSRSQFPQYTLKLAVELLFTTGVRVGELCSIRLGDIDLSEETITIKGKGNRERVVFLVDLEVGGLLQNYIKLREKTGTKSDFLLVTATGKPAQPDYIRRYLHKTSKQAGVQRKVTPHMLRHSAATQLLESGVDIRFVQRLLGHSSISTTEMYTHVSNKSLHRTIRMANPRRNLCEV